MWQRSGLEVWVADVMNAMGAVVLVAAMAVGLWTLTPEGAAAVKGWVDWVVPL